MKLERAIQKVETAIDSAIVPAGIYIEPVLEAARKYANLLENQPTCDHTCLFHYRAVTPLALGITEEE